MKFESIQCLMGISALIVLFLHFLQVSGFMPFGYFFAAQLAVDIFFLLSGYIIVASLRDVENWKRFAIKRFFRIYPLCFVVLVATLIWTNLVNLKEIEFSQIVLNFLFPPFGSSLYKSCIVGVAWSTFFEIFFYFLVTILLFFRVPVRNIHSKIVILISTLYFISFISLYFIPRGINSILDSVRMITGNYHVFMFVAGVLLHKYLCNIQRWFNSISNTVPLKHSRIIVIIVSLLYLGAFIPKYNFLVATIIVPLTFSVGMLYEVINGKISNRVVCFFRK